MTDQPPRASLAAFLGTVQGKLITTLTVIALLLGIAAEGISIVTGYYNMHRARADELKARTQAEALSRRPGLLRQMCDPEMAYYTTEKTNEQMQAMTQIERAEIHNRFCK